MREQNAQPIVGQDVSAPGNVERLVHVDLTATPVRWPAIFVMIVVGATVGVIIVTGGRNSAWIMMGIALPALFLVTFLIRKRVQRQVGRIVEQSPDAPLPALVSQVFKGRRKAGTLGLARATRLGKALAAADRFGQALRLCPTKNATPLRPFDVAFEPQPLDQTGEPFQQLEATGGEEPPEAAPVVSAADDSTWLKIKRNVVLRGGWIIAAIFLFNVLLNVWLSVLQGSLRPILVLWVALFLLTLFGATGATRSRKQWYVVPGGLIVRKAGLRDRRWNVRLLKPPDSTLVIFQAGRHQWIACAAAEDFFDRVVMTKREANFLLRAWLSPLAPPPVEKLTDLL